MNKIYKVIGKSSCFHEPWSYNRSYIYYWNVNEDGIQDKVLIIIRMTMTGSISDKLLNK